jgi:hypothetical protein
VSIQVVTVPAPWAPLLHHQARRLAGVTAAGALLGLLVGGVGGRLAMLLLARLNPEAAGLTSDDGFTIGQFSAATFNLLVVGTAFGVLGAGVYVVLRGLMIGPRWFRLLSISLGPAVVVGSQIVHADGVDFTVLDPAWLGVALFVLIPGVYALLLAVVGERWLAADGPFARSTSVAMLLPLLLWIPLAPVFAGLALGYVALEAVRRRPGGPALLGHPAWAWLGRAILTVVFVAALVELWSETAELV